MTTAYKPVQRVLAIDPLLRGFGWAVLEGDELVVDWGIRDKTSAKPERALAHVAVLIHRFAPHTIVVEDTWNRRCRRGAPARSLIHEIITMAPDADVLVSRVSMTKVRRHFRRLGARNKDAIARNIAERFPELESFLPRRRRMWMSEHDRMSVFDAIAMALIATAGNAAERQPQNAGSRIRGLIRRVTQSSR